MQLVPVYRKRIELSTSVVIDKTSIKCPWCEPTEKIILLHITIKMNSFYIELQSII
jgi:hypothetical protein